MGTEVLLSADECVYFLNMKVARSLMFCVASFVGERKRKRKRE